MKTLSTLELLESERKTAFFHSLWNRYEWLELLQYSPLLQAIHEKSYRDNEYSAIQDSFYALEEQEPNASPAGQVWSKIMADKNFPKLVNMIVDKTSRVNVMNFLTNKFYQVLDELENQKEEEQKEEEEKQKEVPDYDHTQYEDVPDLQDKQEKNGEEQRNEGEEDQEEDEPGDQPGQNSGQGQEQEERNKNISGLRKILSEGGMQGIQSDPQAGPNNLNSTPEEINSVAVSISTKELEELGEQIEGEQALESLTAGTGMSPQEQRQFVEYAFDKFALKNMSKLIGWGEQIVGAAVRENRGATGEFAEISQESWNSRVTPTDMYLVSSGHPLGAAKMAEDKLNTKKHKEETPTGKGSVVFLHDESSSMRDNWDNTHALLLPPEKRTSEQQELLENNPDKDLQAINLQLALAKLFRKEGRPFTAIAWDSSRTRTYKYGQPGLEDHLKAFFNGGTNINHALYKALQVIQEDGQHRNNADIVIATDGDTYDHPSEDPELMKKLEQYKKRGGRIWGVYIGSNVWAAERDKKKMSGYCDFVVNVADLFQSANLREILRKASVDNTKHKKKMI